MRNASTRKVRFLATATAVLLVLTAGASAASTSEAQAKPEGKAPSESKKTQPSKKSDAGQPAQEPAKASEDSDAQGSQDASGQANCEPESLVNTLEDIYGFDQGSRQAANAQPAKAAEEKEKPNTATQKKSDEAQQAVKWRELEPKKDD
jgi:hypothetical protein